MFYVREAQHKKEHRNEKKKEDKRTIDKKIVILSPGNLKAHLTVSMGMEA